MHTPSCPCHTCQARRQRSLATRAPISESEEVELAMELLSVSNEAEWEQFLGKLFKGIGRGLKKVGSFVGSKVLKPLGGALKGLAKKALPLVGGALGSFIPIPGVGTAIGSALGSAVSKALEMEFGEMEAEEAEFEIARRFVRVAASAAQQAGAAPPGMPPEAAVRQALLAAARAHVPSFAANEAELISEAEAEAEYEGEGEYGAEFESQGEAGISRALSGRWQRRGRHIVLFGA
ncbi:hypothetical protein QTI24_10525 [Variovorax sp. J22P240]|uniref:hypothetical protein n=1 Tax=Variovorax sp. J22P240 TaxID=3053514 RepID=UPI002577B6EA|nr:hypothetical protein [Variovorax sp. J22P240]MDL9999037.1 hypothetical protein [Variovorax sp. J22P240]